jgi:Mat/Ecp fimbriae major subunit
MMHKTLRRSLAATAATVAVGLGSHEALATSQTGHANASIVQAIVVTENTQMNFGYIIPSASAGTAVLATSSTVTPTNVTYLNGAVAGAWTATGTPTQPAVITLDVSDTLTSGANTMTIDTFTNDAGGSPTFAAGTGNLSFNVGATLHVGANQAAGNYAGTYTVTVNY